MLKRQVTGYPWPLPFGLVSTSGCRRNIVSPSRRRVINRFLRALERTQLKDFVARLPQGLDLLEFRYLLFLETYHTPKNFPYPDHFNYFLNNSDKLSFGQVI